MRGLLLVVLASVLSGCAHRVADDYAKYLNNNQGLIYPNVGSDAQYLLTPATKNHEFQFRSVMAGNVNIWNVRFGDMLQATLQSRDVQKSFKSLTEAADEKGTANATVIVFNLVNYKFADFKAQVVLQITAKKGNKVLVDNTYAQDGISQGGKIFWGGAFSMKNGVQQSTKDALDKILMKFFEDLKGKK